MDEERDRLAEQIKSLYPSLGIANVPLAKAEVMSDKNDYYTDGNILMIGASSYGFDEQKLEVAANEI